MHPHKKCGVEKQMRVFPFRVRATIPIPRLATKQHFEEIASRREQLLQQQQLSTRAPSSTWII